MKSAIAAVGIFAALANAATFPRMRVRGDNSTVTDGAAQTTLTVIQTNVETIISCAQTVTNCPARQTDIAQLPEDQKTVVTVTNTVVLKTTVCPVSEAPAVSSSVIDDANKGLITGSTVHIITTHIEPEAPEKTDTPGAPVTDSDEKPQAPNNPPKQDKPEDESTTTTTATSTSTRTVTVPAATATKNPNGGSGNGNGGASCPDCDCVASTVTVTAPASTVYITVDGSNKTKDGSSSPTNVVDDEEDDEEEDDEECVAGENVDDEEDEDDEEDSEEQGGEAGCNGSCPDGKDDKGNDKPVQGKDNSPEEQDEEDEECPASTSASVTEATITVIPVPATPSSEPQVTPGVAYPTGFLRVVR